MALGPHPDERDDLPVPGPSWPADDDGDGGGQAGSVRSLVGAVVSAVTRAGRLSLAGAGDALEAPVRALARRSTTAAAERPRPVPDRDALARALSEQRAAPLLGGAAAAAMAARVARRVGPLRFVARRTPLWLVAAVVPALHASIGRGADELYLVASHLHHRARRVGIEVDPDRVRRAAVQIVTGRPVDPDVEPRHADLAVAWLQRAVKATLPFAEGVRTRDPHRLAEMAAAVDPTTLAP